MAGIVRTRRARIGMAGAAAALLVLAGAMLVSAQSHEVVATATSAEGYSSVTVSFTAGAAAAPLFPSVEDGAGTGSLTSAHFGLIGTSGVTITGLTAGSPGVWTLALSGPVDPNVAQVTFDAGLYRADGTSVDVAPAAIPMTDADAADLLRGFAQVDLPLGDLAPVPYAGGWLANRTLQDVPVLAPEGTDEPEIPHSFDEVPDGMVVVGITQAPVPTPLPLTELLPTLPRAGAETTLGATPSQVAIASAIEQLAGVDVTFGNRTMTLSFDDSTWHRDLTGAAVAGGADLGELGVSVLDDFGLRFGLSNSLTLGLEGSPVPGEGDQPADRSGVHPRLETSDLAVRANLPATTGPVAGRVGFVDVTMPNATVGLTATAPLNLTCGTDGSAASALCASGTILASPTLAGSATLTVPKVEIAAKSTVVLDLTAGDGVALPGTWTFDGGPVVVDPDYGSIAPNALTAAQLTGYRNAALHHFQTIDVGAITLGLEYVAGILSTVGQYGEAGQSLPFLGESATEIADISGRVAGYVERFAEEVASAAEDDLAAAMGPSAQDAAALLCQVDFLPTGDCTKALESLQVSTSDIRYGIDLAFTESLWPAGVEPPDLSFDLDLSEVFAFGASGPPPFDVSLAVDAGEWVREADATAGDSGSSATVRVAFTLGIDIRPTAVLEQDDDWKDWIAGVPDTERFGPGGVPYRYQLGEGDLCRGFAASKGTTQTALLIDNDLLLGEEGDSTAPNPVADCDALVRDPGKTITYTDTSNAKQTTAVTATELCQSAASLQGITIEAFRSHNGADDDAACATTVRAAAPTAPSPPTLQYLGFKPSPVTLGHRLFLTGVEGVDLLSASVHLEGRGLRAEARTGFLDVGVVGDVTMTPAVGVAVDSAAGGFDRTPGVVDFAELAKRADATVNRFADDTVPLGTTLAGVFTAPTFSGPIDAAFDFTNSVINVPGAGLDVYGDLADMDAIDFSAASGRLAADRTTVATNDQILVRLHVGSWLSLSELRATQIIDMLVEALGLIGSLVDDDLLAYEVPFTGASLQDMTRIARTAAAIGEGVADRDPETLSAFQAALQQALSDAGVPSNLVVVTVDGTGLWFKLNLGQTTTGSYPFSLSLDELAPGMADALPFSPFDGGAQVTASATLDWAPAFGFSFDDDLDFAQRVLVTDVDPTVKASILADVRGDAHLGPLAVNLNGTVRSLDNPGIGANPSLTFKLSHFGSGGAISLAELQTIDLDKPTDVDDLLIVNGGFKAQLAVGPVPAGSVAVSGQFTDVVALARGTSSTGVTVAISGFTWSDVTLDLGTIVRGTAQTARFVGRTMRSSDTLADGLPVIGDELRAVAGLGDDLRKIADELEAFWLQAEEDSGRFVTTVNTELHAAVCGGVLAHVSDTCSITLLLLDGSGEPGATVGNAQSARLEIDLGYAKTDTLGLGGIDVDGAFSLELDGPMSYTFGYRAGLAMVLDMKRGFAVEPLAEGEGFRPLIELYASLDNRSFDLPVTIAGIPVAKIDGGCLTVGAPGTAACTGETATTGTGGVGPDGEYAGFALSLLGGPGQDVPAITLARLADRRRQPDRLFEPRVAIGADAKLPLLLGDDIAVVPTVSAPVYFSWHYDMRDGAPVAAPLVTVGRADDPITIDAQEIVDGVIEPVFAEIGKANPVDLGPLHELLNKRIDLLETTVRALLESTAGLNPNVQNLLFLIDLAEIADTFATTEVSGKLDLGHMQVLPTFDASQLASDPLGDSPGIGKLVSTMQRLASMAGPGSIGSPPKPPTKPSYALGDGGYSGSTGISASMSAGPVKFPALGDPLALVQLVLTGEAAKDITFIEVNPGTIDIGKSIKWQQELFSLNIGFIDGSLTVGIDGSVGLTLRLGFGYDSRGLTAGHPIYGFYLVDPLDERGRSLPVVAIEARVGAMVDGRFAIAVAGIDVARVRFTGSGYVRASAGLALFTSSPAIPEARRGDGKFHLDDMARVMKAHSLDTTRSSTVGDVADALCLFRPVAQLSAGLSFSGSAHVAGIKVWSGGYTSNWPPLEASTTCGIQPQPAKLVDGVLHLNAGPVHAKDRFDNNPSAHERFTVSLVGSASAPEVQVAWNGQLGKTSVSSTAHNVPFQTLTFPLSQVRELSVVFGAQEGTLNLLAGTGGRLYGELPVTVRGSGQKTDITVAGDVDATITTGRGVANTVTVTNGITEVRATGSNDVVTVGGGTHYLDGDATTRYAFTGTWGEVELDHRGTDARLDFSGAAGNLTGRWGYGEIDVRSSTGSTLSVFDNSVVAHVLGSDQTDSFTIRGSVPDGFTINAGKGGTAEDPNAITVHTSSSDRTFNVEGNVQGVEELTVVGTRAAETYLLRARPDGALSVDDVNVTGDEFCGDEPTPGCIGGADVGFVAVYDHTALQRIREDDGLTESQQQAAEDELPVDRINYDSDVDSLRVDGVHGTNTFVFDDVATTTEVDGGDGGNHFQVGQLFGGASTGGPGEPDEAPYDDSAVMYRIGANVVTDGEARSRNVARRGTMTLGVTHPTTINGGEGDDMFVVYSNAAELDLNGRHGNNTFLLRAFILEGGIGANGGDGDDYFEYVKDYLVNDRVRIDGGTGYNTMVAVGTELGDGFILDHVVDDDGAGRSELFICRIPRVDALGVPLPGLEGLDTVPAPGEFRRTHLPDDSHGDCAINAEFERIDVLIGHGLEGDNLFWVRGSAPGTVTKLFGGKHGSDFYVGALDADAGPDAGGDVSGVQGRVVIEGEGEPAFDVSVRNPIVLPREDATPTDVPTYATENLGLDNSLLVDARRQGGGETGQLDTERISGLGMPDTVTVEPAPDSTAQTSVPGGLTYNAVDHVAVLLGDGGDTFTVDGTSVFTRQPATGPELTIETTACVDTGGGNDHVNVRAVDGPTAVTLPAGDQTVHVGSAATAESNIGGLLTGIADLLHLRGVAPAGDDVICRPRTTSDDDPSARTIEAFLDASGGTAGAVLHSEQRLVTGLDMAGEILHDDLDLLDVRLTDKRDVANVRGTSAGMTRIHGLDADDRFFVSDAARYLVPETPAHLPGALADIAEDLDVVGGGGHNTLMVSDLDGAAAVTGATLEHDRMTGLADGTITYDATGTFAGGVTVWTGAFADVIDVVSTRRDGDPTTLAWGGRPEGSVRTITTVNTGAGDDTVSVDVHDPAEARGDGFLVLNTGNGDDTVEGGTSSLGFVVFGGPGSNAITTGDGDDIVFGDEGLVEYLDGGQVVTRLGLELVANVNDGVARRPVNILTTGAADGDDLIRVGAGDDMAFGGLGDDRIEASDGHNALIGDLGQVWRTDNPTAQQIRSQTGFIDVTVLDGPIAYTADLHDADGGADVILGGADNDWIFGGPGNDILVGSSDARTGQVGGDVIFGGTGDNIIWGGLGDDRIYAGNGDAFVDVKKPTFDRHISARIHSAAWWDRAWTLAPAVDRAPNGQSNGDDLIYGGRGRDVMQADAGGPGRRPGDRLIDWNGSVNLYLTCTSNYGAGQHLRQPSPDMERTLLELALADGAYLANVQTSSGWRQLALATGEHAAANRGAPHTDHPGNNVSCG